MLCKFIRYAFICVVLIAFLTLSVAQGLADSPSFFELSSYALAISFTLMNKQINRSRLVNIVMPRKFATLGIISIVPIALMNESLIGR